MPEAPFTACDAEPIHIPGLIQPHGVLLVLERHAGGLAIIAASANADPVAASDTDPASYLEAQALAVLDTAMAPDAEAPGTARADLPLGLLQDARGTSWDATLRRLAGGSALLELEPPGPAAAAPRHLLDRLGQGLAAIQQQTDATAACSSAVAAVAGVSGFDRVMAYRMMADRSGEVIAEALQPGVAPSGQGLPDSYLGLRFPASDIPAQARALYNSAAVRLIPDARAEPVRLLRLDGMEAPVDLSQAVLRGVAAVHLVYLANMGVKASMSIAISDGKGELWGLFACHHLQGPLQVAPEVRLAAAMLARALSWRLSELEAGLVATRRDKLEAALGAMPAWIAPCAADDAGHAGDPPDPGGLLEACAAAGIAICPRTPGLAPVRLGSAPEAAVLECLCAWLDERVVADRLAPSDWRLQTNALPALLPPGLAAGLAADAAAPCGLVAIRLPEAGWLLLLRPELRRVVTWAGNPDKAIGGPVGSGTAHGPANGHVPGLVPLSPRASFAAWSEEVSGLSEAWSGADLAVAVALRDIIGEVLLQRAAEIARGNEEVRRRSEETRFFADAAAHDLNEPLWQIQVLSGLIGEGLEDLPADQPPDPETIADLRQMTQSVVGSAGRMQAMIAELSRLAVAGHQADRSSAVALHEVACEALEDIRRGQATSRDLTGAALASARIDLDGLAAISIRADRGQIRRVFQNLFSNALKYRDPDRPLRVMAEGRRDVAGQVQVQVSDNGVGFDPAHAAHLFEPFRRFPNRAAAGTPGLGLGLAICQRIVLAHGGAIEAVPPADGPGACFRFSLAEPVPAALEEHAGALDAAGLPGDPV